MTDQQKNLSRTSQRLWLANQLNSKDFFRRCRNGELPKHAFDFLQWVVEHTENPSQFKATWNRTIPDLFHLGTVMAKANRDNMPIASADVAEALACREYFLYGESVSEADTTPITMVMVDPESTLLLVHLLAIIEQAIGVWGHDFRKHWVTINCSTLATTCSWKQRKRLTPELDRLRKLVFDTFPKMQERHSHWAEKLTEPANYPAIPILDTYTQFVTELLGTHLELEESWCSSGHMRLLHVDRKNIPFSGMLFRPWSDNSNTDSRGYFCDNKPRSRTMLASYYNFSPLAFVVQGEATEVLATHGLQNDPSVATWQFRMPNNLLEASITAKGAYKRRDLPIGIHPAKEHEAWTARHPALVSNSTSHGYGAILHIPSTHRWEEYVPYIMGRRFLFH